MTTPQTWTPAYIRRAPGWHDGAGRLLDFGGVFDLKIYTDPGFADAEAIAEDLLMVKQDLRRALNAVQHAQ